MLTNLNISFKIGDRKVIFQYKNTKSERLSPHYDTRRHKAKGALTQEEIIAIYVEKMIADKGVEPTDELRAELRTKLSDEITKQMVLAMPDYLVSKLNEEMEKGADEDTVNKLIDESGIDVETITEQTMNNFRDNYLNGEEK